MASLNLGDLQVGVKVNGADKAKQELKGVQEAAKGVESQSTNTSGGMSGLTKAFKDGIGNASAFGIKLGDLGGALGGGAGLTSLMQGAVAGLAMALVNLAVQAIQQAIAALIDFGKQAVKVASDLEESANVVDVVFGKENNVTKWANENAKAFNLSALEAQKFAGTMGAVLTPSGLGVDVIEDMSINLTKLSGDLGSLWNKSSEEAFNALRSAITGETEPMKAFGVVMTQVNLEAYALSQGIDKTWQSMTQAEQALIRYNYILENTRTSQGDATRTADGYANATKQLEIATEDAGNSLGKGLLPALTSMKQFFADFLNDNKELLEFIGNALGLVLNIIVEVTRAIYGALRPIIEVINYIFAGLNEALAFLNEGIHEASNEIREDLRGTSKEVTYTMQDISKATEDAAESSTSIVEELFGTMEESAKTSLENISNAYKSYFEKQMSDYEKQLREQFNGGTLAEEKKIQRKLALHEEMLKKQLEKDEEYERKRAEFASKYRVVTTTNGNSTSVSYVPRNANGTLNFGGGLTRMNEIGPELTFIPGSGAQIINNHETKEMFNNIGDNRGVETRLDVLIGAIQKVERVIQMLSSEQQMLARGGVV